MQVTLSAGDRKIIFKAPTLINYFLSVLLLLVEQVEQLKHMKYFLIKAKAFTLFIRSYSILTVCLAG